MTRPLLEAKDLRKHFPITKGLLFSRTVGWIKAVDGIDFAIPSGSTFALVGESGSGKTTTAKLILLLERATSGSLYFDGQQIYGMKPDELKRYRRSIQAVFQDPFSSLNPRMRVGSIISEPVVINDSLDRAALNERVGSLLEQVGLSAEDRNLYPHEFSGGQRQRIAVARALAPSPRLIILDEPVSALDVSIRAQIMNLLKDLQQEFGLTYLLIAHFLATVRYMSTFVAVMYAGKIVEAAPSEELFTHPLHPYTQALLWAALPAHPSIKREETPLKGEVPNLLTVPFGCPLNPRCPRAFGPCSQTKPQLLTASPGHTVSCHIHHQGGAP